MENRDPMGPVELHELSKTEGMPLTDEQLDQVVGGGTLWNPPTRCPKCKSTRIRNYTNQWFCRACGHKWTESLL